MYLRPNNRAVRNSVALIIVAMVIPTVGFIAAGSVDPRMHRERHCEIVAEGNPPLWECGEPYALIADHPYPIRAVVGSCGLVLAEGLLVSLIWMRTGSHVAWGALLAGVAAGILAVQMRAATLGLPSWYGYVTYHYLWLVCAAALMFALVLVCVADAAFRRFYPTPAIMPLKRMVGGGRPPTA